MDAVTAKKYFYEFHALLQQVEGERWQALDLLPQASRTEKLLALALNGPPPGPSRLTATLADLGRAFNQVETGGVRVVVFGGGTGLSNLIGGDSRHPAWPDNPFSGLKSLFPQVRAVVCATDDGGSTGELLKDLPLIALGDLRHVLLSSVRRDKLQKQYELDEAGAARTVRALHRLFNHRCLALPAAAVELRAELAAELAELPVFMERSLAGLIEEIFHNPRFAETRQRPHCLGNLLLAAAICQAAGLRQESATEIPAAAVLQGIHFLADLLGASPDAVLPAATTPAQLKILYDNGVLVSGEDKSSLARRNCPVDRVFVEFAGPPRVSEEVLAAVAAAEIIIFAPGSLFTSILPILQVPGLAEAVRKNRHALKLLCANLWIQAGETDLAQGGRQRRFHVSDLLRAYQRNIPGGLDGLFRRILVMGLQEIPGSILQGYALEDKVPIYLDRENVRKMGFCPVEAAIYSQADIDRRRVVQHDPASVARAVRALWALNQLPAAEKEAATGPEAGLGSGPASPGIWINPRRQTPDQRRREVQARLAELAMAPADQAALRDIFWHHGEIPVSHLDQVAGLRWIAPADWKRCQSWDNVFSFYDPADRLLKLRQDVAADPVRLEIALLVALGQSLLGNYAAAKEKLPIAGNGDTVGYIFQLSLRPEEERRAFLNGPELSQYLHLARMSQSAGNPLIFTRMISGEEGFTPPGLLFGLTYAWYLDNRFAPNIEHKMSITRAESSDLVPEQDRIANRRQGLINFFRTKVFRYPELV